ncbi:MAG: two-component sensor histidine kinase [Rhodobacteraceae bacterium]|nr:two-component sensor histidine kinase [Paracoccaceae bacterium]
MWTQFLKNYLPRSFYGRAVLILIVPIIVIQIVLSIVFIQRHYERVTERMTENLMREVLFLTEQIDAAPALEPALNQLAPLKQALLIDIGVAQNAQIPYNTRQIARLDLAGAEIIRVLDAELPGFLAADLISQPNAVLIWVNSRHGILQLVIPRRLLTTSNPHQLLVIVFMASVLMAAIAFQFLRLQIRPIRRLALAAEAYGRGASVPFTPSGAREIRAAGLAFANMRNRIERQNAQRKLMLSGVSHDMRTPLTRMRLILSMMEDSDEKAALEAEIAELSALLDGFLDYSRGQAAEDPELTDIIALIRDQIQRHQASGRIVSLRGDDSPIADLRLRRGLIERALDNLLSNALRYGKTVEVSLARHPDGWLEIAVEDDGPGIAEADRARAVEPFTRLDEARNRDMATGVGLGLAIVSEALRSHSGQLVLEDSARLGGLRAVMRLPLRPAAKPHKS